MAAAAPFLIVLLVLLAAPSCAPPTPTLVPPTKTPVPEQVEDGIIVRIEGDVQLRRLEQESFQPAREGDMVIFGDEIKTGPESEATVLCANYEVQLIEALSEKDVLCRKEPLEPAPDQWTDYAYSSMWNWYRGEFSPLAPLALLDEGLYQRPIIVSPAGTALVKPDARFRWMPVPDAAEYRVMVSREEVVIWTHYTSATMVDPSEVPPLTPGATYTLKVEALVDEAPVSNETEFVVLDQEKVSELKVLEAQFFATPDPETSPLTLASLYRRFGLQGEAIYQLEEYASKKPIPSNALLGQWYLEAGFPRIAEQYYEQASKEYDQLGLERGQANALLGLGLSDCLYGNLEDGTHLLWESYDLFEELGDTAGMTAAIGFVTNSCTPGP